MEKDDIGNRMTLGTTVILTIMFLLGSLNGNLPKVSYPKVVDWYLLVSLSFVLLSLLKSIIVYVLVRATKMEKKIKCQVSVFKDIVFLLSNDLRKQYGFFPFLRKLFGCIVHGFYFFFYSTFLQLTLGHTRKLIP